MVFLLLQLFETGPTRTDSDTGNGDQANHKVAQEPEPQVGHRAQERQRSTGGEGDLRGRAPFTGPSGWRAMPPCPSRRLPRAAARGQPLAPWNSGSP